MLVSQLTIFGPNLIARTIGPNGERTSSTVATVFRGPSQGSRRGLAFSQASPALRLTQAQIPSDELSSLRPSFSLTQVQARALQSFAFWMSPLMRVAVARMPL